jgi:hypothetical protein
MIDLKMKLMSVVAVITVSAMIISCGVGSARTVEVPEVAVAKAAGLAKAEEKASSGEEYASVYLDKITEYDKEGKADSYALIDVNDDDIPELAVASSAGELDEEGNAHLFTVSDGKLVELMSLSSGYDGNHIFVSEGKNVILRTGGMSGSETYDVYTLKDGELEQTKGLIALYDFENDSYIYYVGEKIISEQQYTEEFTEAISEYNSYTGIDYDGLNKTDITLEDGFTNIETISTKAYMTFDEMKELLGSK